MIQIDMPMPATCYDCPCCYDCMSCALTEKSEFDFEICDEQRMPYCPLQDVPDKNVGKWISVEDDLPKKNEIVIASDGVHAWEVGQFKGLCYTPNRTEDNPRRDYWNWKKNTVKTVKWWMPKEKALPEPPKEET